MSPSTFTTQEQVALARAEIIRQHGVWTDHNIYLGHGEFTIGPEWASEKLRRIVQVVSDESRQPLAGLRILDLACLEGGYSIEFGLHGAEVVGIEGRSRNVEKACFAQRALGLSNVSFVQDDVRNLEQRKYGEFDVVLCLGILYHLDTPDVFDLVFRIASVCRGFAIFDTFTSTKARAQCNYQGQTYWGRYMSEHRPDATVEEKLADPWASLDNSKSFWISRSSLFNLLINSGFSSASEVLLPREQHKPSDRVTIVAHKGSRARILTVPQAESLLPSVDYPEHYHPPVSFQQKPSTEFSRAVSKRIPGVIKRSMKKLLSGVRGDKETDRWQGWNKGRRG